MNDVIPKCDGCICISHFLQKHLPLNMTSVVVPPLALDYKKPVLRDDRVILFSYASVLCDKDRPTSEWKDRIDSIVDVFFELHKDGIENFKLHFIGFNKEQLLDMFTKDLRDEYDNKLSILNKNIVYWGVLNNKDASQIIASSDFSILIRLSTEVIFGIFVGRNQVHRPAVEGTVPFADGAI